MKWFLLALTVLAGCSYTESKVVGDPKTGYYELQFAGGCEPVRVWTFEIDGCEYLYSNGLAHKGNCKHCAARNR